MILKPFVLTCVFFIPITSLFLTFHQSNLIQSILKNKQTTNSMKDSINNILYNAYEKYAIHQAFTFKKFHKQKCYNIKMDDLILSSKLGLFKSIKKYKGNTNFENYSKKYIQWELYKCLTDFHDITIIPKSIRRKNKSNFTWIERRKYNKRLKTSYVSNVDFWRFDKIQSKLLENSNIYQEDKFFLERSFELWFIINQYFDSCIFAKKNKRIFLLKYDFEFKVIRSNANISHLMGCSEEYIRLILQKMKKELYNILLKQNEKKLV